MELRREQISFPIEGNFRILHVSDVHFSRKTKHPQNRRVIRETAELAGSCGRINAVCVTGDLVSRHFTAVSLADAMILLQTLQSSAPVLYSFGNHEMDWTPAERIAFVQDLERIGVTVLDNQSTKLGGITFCGLSLPQGVYKNPRGHYWDLLPVTREMITDCIGECPAHPCVLLAHTPLGFPAYAAWGADAVLSGHVHGGIIRVGDVGLLSPERRFLPKFTKGIFREGSSVMNVSAGIGKFRLHNPAEVVCIDLAKADTDQEV